MAPAVSFPRQALLLRASRSVHKHLWAQRPPRVALRAFNRGLDHAHVGHAVFDGRWPRAVFEHGAGSGSPPAKTSSVARSRSGRATSSLKPASTSRASVTI